MSEADKMSHILDAKYKKANLSKIMRETLHLKGTEQDKLKSYFKNMKNYLTVPLVLGKWTDIT